MQLKAICSRGWVKPNEWAPQMAQGGKYKDIFDAVTPWKFDKIGIGYWIQ